MILLEKTIHEFPRLDDNVKSLDNDSSVTNNNTMICQALLWYSRSKNFTSFHGQFSFNPVTNYTTVI